MRASDRKLILKRVELLEDKGSLSVSQQAAIEVVLELDEMLEKGQSISADIVDEKLLER